MTKAGSMKVATLYERRSGLYVHSSSKTTSGVWIVGAPVLNAKKDDVGQLGNAIRQCLEASSEGVPHPKSFANISDPLLALAGVKSFNAFAKSAKCVEIEMVGETVTMIPTRNGGGDEGFVPLLGKANIVGSENDVLGSAAITALALAE